MQAASLLVAGLLRYIKSRAAESAKSFIETEISMVHLTHTGVVTGAFGQRFGRLLAGLWARLRVWHDRRVTRRELMRLSERELADIGLTRADIERIVQQIR